MALSLVGTVLAQIQTTYSNPLDLSTTQDVLQKTCLLALANGTGLDAADRIWSDQVTLAASGTADLDLAGVLTDAFGNLITFARLKAIFVKAALANTNNVNVTRPASNGVPFFLAAGDGVAVRPNGCFLLAAPDAIGYVVTAATGDLITFTNSAAGTSVTYDVVLIGASA